MINVRKTWCVPNFKQNNIDTLLDYLSDGYEELTIVADYSLEEILAFESEIRQGEHAKAKNLPAILTARLKALP